MALLFLMVFRPMKQLFRPQKFRAVAVTEQIPWSKMPSDKFPFYLYPSQVSTLHLAFLVSPFHELGQFTGPQLLLLFTRSLNIPASQLPSILIIAPCSVDNWWKSLPYNWLASFHVKSQEKKKKSHLICSTVLSLKPSWNDVKYLFEENRTLLHLQKWILNCLSCQINKVILRHKIDKKLHQKLCTDYLNKA